VTKEKELKRIIKWTGKRHELVDCRIDVMKREEGSMYPHSTKDRDWKPPRWVSDGKVQGKVFVWARDPEDKKLQEGKWDEEEWEMFEKYRWVDVKRWGKENEREMRAAKEAKKWKRKTGEVNERERETEKAEESIRNGRKGREVRRESGGDWVLIKGAGV
jgi:hypothetical protein